MSVAAAEPMNRSNSEVFSEEEGPTAPGEGCSGFLSWMMVCWRTEGAEESVGWERTGGDPGMGVTWTCWAMELPVKSTVSAMMRSTFNPHRA
jgi:hypothetical protein